jgi:hypothetical protein
LRDAERLYRLVVAYNPHHINAQDNLGVLALQVGRPDSAIMLIGKAVAIRGRVHEWHYNLASALRRRSDGRLPITEPPYAGLASSAHSNQR